VGAFTGISTSGPVEHEVAIFYGEEIAVSCIINKNNEKQETDAANTELYSRVRLLFFRI